MFFKQVKVWFGQVNKSSVIVLRWCVAIGGTSTDGSKAISEPVNLLGAFLTSASISMQDIKGNVHIRTLSSPHAYCYTSCIQSLQCCTQLPIGALSE